MQSLSANRGDFLGRSPAESFICVLLGSCLGQKGPVSGMGTRLTLSGPDFFRIFGVSRLPCRPHLRVAELVKSLSIWSV